MSCKHKDFHIKDLQRCRFSDLHVFVPYRSNMAIISDASNALKIEGCPFSSISISYPWL